MENQAPPSEFLTHPSLKTLPGATEQEVYDVVARHLLTQNAKSATNTRGCLYRGGGPLRCAAGCLIADDEYDPSFENRSWTALASAYRVPSAHAQLIGQLQNIHDNRDVETWRAELQKLARDFHLEPCQ